MTEEEKNRVLETLLDIGLSALSWTNVAGRVVRVAKMIGTSKVAMRVAEMMRLKKYPVKVEGSKVLSLNMVPAVNKTLDRLPDAAKNVLSFLAKYQIVDTVTDYLFEVEKPGIVLPDGILEAIALDYLAYANIYKVDIPVKEASELAKERFPESIKYALGQGGALNQELLEAERKLMLASSTKEELAAVLFVAALTSASTSGSVDAVAMADKVTALISKYSRKSEEQPLHEFKSKPDAVTSASNRENITRKLDSVYPVASVNGAPCSVESQHEIPTYDIDIARLIVFIRNMGYSEADVISIVRGLKKIVRNDVPLLNYMRGGAWVRY